MSDPKSNPKLGEVADETTAEKDKPWWSEMMKEVTLTGLATIFMTEEGVRGYLKEKKLPKELVALLIDGFSKKKDNFYEMCTREFGRVLGKIDLTKEFQKFMETHDVNVQAKVSFTRKDKKNE